MARGYPRRGRHHLTGHDRGLQIIIGQRAHLRADGLVQYPADRVQRGHHRVTDPGERRVVDEFEIEAGTGKLTRAETAIQNYG
jgi:hypothetical protein